MDYPRMAGDGFDHWQIENPHSVAFDTETSGVDFHDQPFCVTVAWRSPRHGGMVSHYFDLIHAPESPDMIEVILDTSPRLIGHNLKFDLQKVILAGLLKRERLCAERLADTEALAHLQDEHRRKGLKYLAHKLLGQDTDEETEVKEAKKKIKKAQGFRSESEIGYDLLPRGVIVPYALKDAEFTYRLWELLEDQVAEHADLHALYRMEMELLLVLLDMETAGFGVDLAYAEDATRDYGRKIVEAELAIEEIVGVPVGKNVKKGEFNPGSPKQLTEWFNDERGIVLPSTDKAALAKVNHPLAEAVLALRHNTKLHSTYFRPLLMETQNGVLHPNFRQHGTKTGRMSSGGATA